MKNNTADIYIDMSHEEMKAVRSIMRERRKALMRELGI